MSEIQDSSSIREPDNEESQTQSPTTSQGRYDPWASNNLLSLDGGGERGLASLYLMKHLMDKIGEYERQKDPKASSSAYTAILDPPHNSYCPSGYLPCHYFDYIGGSSTAGSVALMLGRLRMNVDDAIEEYKGLSQVVLPENSSLFKALFNQNDNENCTKNLNNQFNRLASNRHSRSMQSDPARCRTVIFSDKSIEQEFRFRSYAFANYGSLSARWVDWRPSKINQYQISDVASTAIADNLALDNDVEALFNRSDWKLLDEVSSTVGDAVDLLLSVGGGDWGGEETSIHPHNKEVSRRYYIRDIILESRVNGDSKRLSATYYRWNVEGVSNFTRLYDWKPKKTGAHTVQRIKEATERFLRQDAVASECEELANLLVNKRIERSNTMRWESFATGIRYKCPLSIMEGSRCENVFPHREALMNHLRVRHNVPPSDLGRDEKIKDLLDRGRFNPEERLC